MAIDTAWLCLWPESDSKIHQIYETLWRSTGSYNSDFSRYVYIGLSKRCHRGTMLFDCQDGGNL